MIRSFRDRETELTFSGRRSRRLPPEIQASAFRKLILIDLTDAVDQLRVPPGNRLEALAGDRAGEHSIRINDQWRICFRWDEGNAYEVEITDYH